jgi:hypothetical protein
MSIEALFGKRSAVKDVLATARLQAISLERFHFNLIQSLHPPRANDESHKVWAWGGSTRERVTTMIICIPNLRFLHSALTMNPEWNLGNNNLRIDDNLLFV